MAQHNETGDLGEELAAQYLSKNGYEIVATNWRYKKAEIDIIAEKDNLIVIVEVKTRSTNQFGDPEVFVTMSKQRLIVKAAHAYIVENDIEKEARFDIISVLLKGSAHEINHIEEAFYPTL
jgi:putative endonuclease